MLNFSVYRVVLITLICCLTVVSPLQALEKSDITKVVLLGTGTPIPNPERSGPAIAIVVNDTPYLVDFGPGVVRQATSMSPTYGGDIEGLEIHNIGHAFLTHLHSDHTAGLPDLLLSPWVMGRNKPLQLFGPEGTEEMVHHITKAYDHDIKYRLYGLEPANNKGWRTKVQLISEGVVYKDENVTVEAFPVVHGNWPNAYGYRFTTPDRVIVISGDAAPDVNVEKYSRGADILIHEVYAIEGFNTRNKFWQKYHRKNHTSAHELAKIASRAKPKLLVLNHILLFTSSEEQLLKEVQELYDGDVVLGNDLDVF